MSWRPTILSLGAVVLVSASIACRGDKVDSAPDAGTSQCCPLETPTCDCFSYGGKRHPNNPNMPCPGICDAVPTNWRMSVDDAGCPVLVQIDPGESCLRPRPDPPRDAGTEVQPDTSTGNHE